MHISDSKHAELTNPHSAVLAMIHFTRPVFRLNNVSAAQRRHLESPGAGRSPAANVILTLISSWSMDRWLDNTAFHLYIPF